jgi:hypothetical protein
MHQVKLPLHSLASINVIKSLPEPMGMPRPLKQKQERSREDEGAASSSKRPKHYKTLSTDHFDAVNLTTPKPIDTIDLTQSDPEPGMNLLYHCMIPLTHP